MPYYYFTNGEGYTKTEEGHMTLWKDLALSLGVLQGEKSDSYVLTGVGWTVINNTSYYSIFSSYKSPTGTYFLVKTNYTIHKKKLTEYNSIRYSISNLRYTPSMSCWIELHSDDVFLGEIHGTLRFVGRHGRYL